MQIKEAADFFKNLLESTDKKSERKIYERFLYILNVLENKPLSTSELKSIEETLGNLELDAEVENRHQYLKKKLKEFETFLQNQYSFVSEGHYLGLSIAIGLTFGSMVGTMIAVIFGFSIVLGINFGIMAGMIIGIFVGMYLDSAAENQGRVLKADTV